LGKKQIFFNSEGGLLVKSLNSYFILFIAYPTSNINHNLRSQMRCSYTSIQRGVMPQGGFSRDYVEHVGTVRDVKECVRSCCGSRDCDMAFMLANHCYRISCSREPKKCEPTKAKGKNRFVSKLVKLTRKPIDGEWSELFARYTRKTAQVVTDLQTSCYKFVHKPSTSCVRTACSQLL
jgi:hypothetical protein